MSFRRRKASPSALQIWRSWPRPLRLGLQYRSLLTSTLKPPVFILNEPFPREHASLAASSKVYIPVLNKRFGYSLNAFSVFFLCEDLLNTGSVFCSLDINSLNVLLSCEVTLVIWELNRLIHIFHNASANKWFIVVAMAQILIFILNIIFNGWQTLSFF